MNLTRRAILRLGAGASVLPLMANPLGSQSAMAGDVSAASATPLARRLADYALGLRYEDLDSATIERVKIHLIDSLGCGVGALNEPAVRICREIALPVGGTSTIIGTNRRTTPDLAAFANGAPFAISILTTHMSASLPFIQATTSRRALRWPKPSARALRS